MYRNPSLDVLPVCSPSPCSVCFLLNFFSSIPFFGIPFFSFVCVPYIERRSGFPDQPIGQLEEKTNSRVEMWVIIYFVLPGAVSI